MQKRQQRTTAYPEVSLRSKKKAAVHSIGLTSPLSFVIFKETGCIYWMEEMFKEMLSTRDFDITLNLGMQLQQCNSDCISICSGELHDRDVP